ncbi:MAG: glycosyltransferase family 39 protein [Candidatus Calescibacterium sp.]|nr:glycosyltransferase family 39 protein [Candidatus Calescibacterium sp.]MCX7733575.1 glycosyltransferase family 39 protein [bacterium]
MRKYIVFLLVAGFFLRIWKIWEKSLWADEILYLDFQKFDLQLIQSITITLSKYLINKLPIENQEIILRLPHIIMSSISILIVYRIYNLLDRSSGLTAAILLCFSFFITILTQDASGWAICLLFYLLSIYEFIKIKKNIGGKPPVFLMYLLGCFFSKEISAIWVFPLIIAVLPKIKKYVFIFIPLTAVLTSIIIAINYDKINITRDIIEVLYASFEPKILSPKTYVETLIIFSGSWWELLAYIQIAISIFGIAITDKRREIFYFLLAPSVITVILAYILFDFFSTRYLLPLFLAYIVGITEAIKYISTKLSEKLRIPETVLKALLVCITIISNIKTFYEYWKLPTTFFVPIDISEISKKICESEKNSEISARIISPQSILKIPAIVGLKRYLRKCRTEIIYVEDDDKISGITKRAGVKTIESINNQNEKKYVFVLIPYNLDASGIKKWWERMPENYNQNVFDFINTISQKENIRINRIYTEYGIIGFEARWDSQRNFERFEERVIKFLLRNMRKI